MTQLSFPNHRNWIVRVNFGDESIALMRWLHENAHLINPKIYCVYVSTGWESQLWVKQVEQGVALAKQYQFEPIVLNPLVSFSDMVIGRGSFPQENHQWCASLLKGIPFLSWLDEFDENNESVIILPKRTSACHTFNHLSEWIESCEYHGRRSVWHPMIHINDSQRNNLIHKAGFEPLNTRSQECFPCMLHTKKVVDLAPVEDKRRLIELEQMIGQTFSNRDNTNNHEKYPGCGQFFGCGL